MASEPSRSSLRGLELDWVIVSLATLRRWGLGIVLLILASGVLIVAYLFLHEPIDRRAQTMIRRATAAQEEVRRSGPIEGVQGEFDQASRLLDEAHHDWDRQDYPACLARAKDALRRFELLSGLVNRDFTGSGQIIAIQGKVEVQRANQTSWGRASEKQPLYNGDFVKTGEGSSAEIFFNDGTIFHIGPDSLLEVHRESRRGQSNQPGEVKVKVGQVNVYTALNPSSVVTDAARAEVESESRVGVEVADDSSTTVAAYAGRAHVTGSEGDHAEISSLQAISAAPGQKLSGRRAVPDRPLLDEPVANTLVDLDATNRVSLRWSMVPGAARYALQVSRSRTFQNLEVDAEDRESTGAVLKITRPGTYFWRVAALAPDKVRSEWSDPRSFKAFAGARVEVVSDTTPPRLEVQRPAQMGSVVIVQGTTEPGVTVVINGESVEVNADGSFRKTLALNRDGLNTIIIRATDPAGNSTEERKQVYVEAD